MTVPSEQSRIQYTTDGTSVSFPVPFRFLNASHLQVARQHNDESSILELGVDYSVSGVGNQAGGTITTTTTLPAGNSISIERVVPITQETAYQRNDPFPERAHEQALDKLTMICQMLGGVLGLTPGSVNRALLLGAGDTDGKGSYRANGNRIQGVGDAKGMLDAVNKRLLLEYLSKLSTDESGQFVVERLADNTNSSNGAGMVGLNSDVVGTVEDALLPLVAAPAEDSLYLATFFHSNTDVGVLVASSLDGENFTVNIGKNENGGHPFVGRDPSIIYKNGEFLVAVTDYQKNAHDIAIWRSRDLLNWTKTNVALGAQAVCSDTRPAPGGSVPCDRVWAPEWHIDTAGNLYVLVSLRFAADEEDINGNVIRYFRPFYSQCLNINSLEFSPPTPMNIGSENTIDPDVEVVDGRLIAAIKNERTKKIQFFTGLTLGGPWQFLSELSSSGVVPAEGPCIVKTKSGWRVYFDRYEEWNTAFVDTTDFQAFTPIKPINIGSLHRHGTILSMHGFTDVERNYVRSRLLLNPAVAQKSLSIGRWDLRFGTNSIVPAHGVTYRVTGSTHAVVDLVGNLPDEITFVLATGASAAVLEISQGPHFLAYDGVSDIYTPGGYKDRTIILRKDIVSGQYRVVGHAPCSGRGQSLLEAVGGNAITTAWLPKNGHTYTTSGSDGSFVVQGVANAPDGTKFHLLILSNSAGGSIEFTAGFLGTGRPSKYRGDFGWDGVLITVEKQVGRWRLSVPHERSNAVTYTPGSIGNNSEKITDVPVTGARSGDLIDVSFSRPLGVIELDASVLSDDVVQVRFRNRGSSLSLPEGVIKVRTR